MDDPGEVVIWLFIFALVTALASVLCVLTRHWQRAAEVRQQQQRQQQQQQQHRERQADQRRQHHLALLRHLEQESAALLTAIGLPRIGGSPPQEETRNANLESWCPAKPYETVREALEGKETPSEEPPSSSSVGISAATAATAAEAATAGQRHPLDGKEHEEETPGAAAAAAAAADPLVDHSFTVVADGGARTLQRRSSNRNIDRDAFGGPGNHNGGPLGKGTPGDDSNVSCSICFESFSSSAVVRLLPCKHLYHRCCIDAWFDRSPLCPLCMRDYTDELGGSSSSFPHQGGSLAIADASAALALLAFLENHQTSRATSHGDV